MSCTFHLREAQPKELAGALDSHFQRRDAGASDLSHFLVLEAFHVTQQERFALRGGECRQGCLDLLTPDDRVHIRGRPAVLRAAITRVETVSPALNALSALVLVVPLDRGGASVDIEALDPDTGKQLAALTQGHFAPLSELKAHFSKLAPAQLALRKAAADFGVLMRPTDNARDDR